MFVRFLLAGAALAIVTSPLGAQARRASLRSGGGDEGKCTIEVVVDGAAEVEVRGDSAVLRNLAGQPAQWRRFECNGPRPNNPVDFRFAGVDGRGRQELVRDPRNGGAAVVRIEDPQGGSEGYTFDLFWNNRGGFEQPRGGFEQPRGGVIDRGGPPRGRFSTEDAVRGCQDMVRQQAMDRLRTRDMEFRRTAIDDRPGRNDWVVGTLAVRRGPRDEVYNFSCSVDFNSGRVRSAQIDPLVEERGNPRAGGRAIENCQRAVEDRIRRDGYDRVSFESINADNRPGRNDWVVGNAVADRRNRSDRFQFNCSVNMGNGDVRSVDVRPR